MVRRPIVMAASVEKLGLCALIAAGWNNPSLHGLHGALFVDGVCVLLYAIYLFTDPKPAVAT